MARGMSDAEKAEIIEMTEAGVTVGEIASEIGRTTATIYGYLHSVGIGPAKKSGDWLEGINDIDELWEDYYNEMPMKELMKKYGIPNSTAFYNLLREVGKKARTLTTENVMGRQIAMDHAVKLYKEGVVIWRICEETGVHQPQLHKELHKRGVPLRRSRKGKSR